MAGMKMFVRSAVLVAAAVAAVAAPAAVSAPPDVSQMALRAADVPASRVSGHNAKPDPGYVAAYERTFQLRKPYGPSKIVYIESDVDLAATAAKATSDFGGIRAFLRTKKGREAFAAAFVRGAGKNVTRKDLALGALRTPRIGDQAVELPASVHFGKGRIYLALTIFRVDRAVSLLITIGARPTVQGDVTKLSSLIVAHIGEQLVPVSTAPPAVTGTPQQGQTVTASPGTWSGAPTFTYQWQHCDATGAACTDVAGATASTYAVTATDVAFTLRVNVTATNRFGTATVQSAQTAVVT
jgi:hypothetical protein